MTHLEPSLRSDPDSRHRTGVSRQREPQGNAVIAVSKAGWFRPVVKYMTLVAEASRAMIFGARNAQPVVGFFGQGAGKGCVKTWPTRLRIVLPGRLEEREVASKTPEQADAMFLEERTGERPLGTVVPQNIIGSRWQPAFPIGIAQFAPGRRRPGIRSGVCRGRVEPKGRRAEQEATPGRSKIGSGHHASTAGVAARLPRTNHDPVITIRSFQANRA